MSTITPVSDDCIVIEDATWDLYEAHLAARGERRRPRLAFQARRLEIMSTGVPHEELAGLVSHLVLTLIEVWNLDMVDHGATTFKHKPWGKGFEADACFYLETAPDVRGRREVDVQNDPPPDIIVEVDITRSSMRKLPIYKRFGVREVWRHDGERVTIFVLRDDGYAQRDASALLPSLTAAALTDLLDAGRHTRMPDWLAQVRAWATTTGPAVDRPADTEA